MKIGIVGLGLIGGSLAKAYKFSHRHEVFGTDINNSITQIAIMSEFIDGSLDENLSQCDFVFLAVGANACVEFVKENATKFKKDSIVVDCCGVKEIVCAECFKISSQNSFHFVGGHPMAGTQYSGLKYSRQDLFYGANMVLVPKASEQMQVLQKLKEILLEAGFDSVSITTASEHDRIIAFTSQLAHVVSNAFVKSPTALYHKGFSAGSYKDLTRVAWLNEEMWAMLFLQNKANISIEIRGLINELTKYADAIDNNDKQTLKQLLKDGRERKERCDKPE